jgi:RND family efflux transporter MFP subunit
MKVVTPLAAVLTLALAGCAKSPPAVAPAAEKPKVEADLARTTLSAEAAKSLAIVSEVVAAKPVRDRLRLTGWVTAPPGREAALTAPVAGHVRHPPSADELPAPGRAVAAKQVLFQIEPVLSPLEQVQLAALQRGVEGELTKARESVALAEKELSLFADLQRQGLRSQQELDQARTRLAQAREDQSAAEDKRKLYAASLKPVAVEAPRAGTVLSVAVAPGQYVAAAAPLLTVADLSEQWLRVPVPEHDLPRVEAGEPLTAVAAPGRPGWKAVPVAQVPAVDALRRTVDLLYKLERPAGAPPLPRDRMLTVEVPLRAEVPTAGGAPVPGFEKACVVPYSAVVFDAQGSAWVYVDLSKDGSAVREYERRRVELGAAEGDGVAVRPAPKDGERVVTAGAAALFSREFHKPPAVAPAPVDDDD